MSKKLKLYLVSILGVSRTYKDDQPKSLYVHLPIMVEAKDIDSAVRFQIDTLHPYGETEIVWGWSPLAFGASCAK